MIYKVTIPLAGFEDEEEFEFVKVDTFFSFIKSTHSELEIRIMNFDAIKNFEFDIDDEEANKLQLLENTNFSVYYIFVLQHPVNKSIVNMFAPLIFNHDKKLMGQAQVEIGTLGLEVLENIIPNF
jgi:flagellar assembly factor FliW